MQCAGYGARNSNLKDSATGRKERERERERRPCLVWSGIAWPGPKIHQITTILAQGWGCDRNWSETYETPQPTTGRNRRNPTVHVHLQWHWKSRQHRRMASCKQIPAKERQCYAADPSIHVRPGNPRAKWLSASCVVHEDPFNYMSRRISKISCVAMDKHLFFCPA